MHTFPCFRLFLVIVSCCYNYFRPGLHPGIIDQPPMLNFSPSKGVVSVRLTYHGSKLSKYKIRRSREMTYNNNNIEVGVPMGIKATIQVQNFDFKNLYLLLSKLCWLATQVKGKRVDQSCIMHHGWIK